MLFRNVIAGLVLACLMLPAHAQEREWTLDAADEDVYLLFGVPNTTDVGVSFWCKISSREVSLFTPLPPNTSSLPTISLIIDATTYTLTPTASADQNSNTIEAKLQPQDKIISELEKAERFTLMLDKHKAVYPLEGADFSNLLKLCAARASE
jgi:hypothetical protein